MTALSAKVWDQELGRWLRLDGGRDDANEVTEVDPRKDRRRMVSGREPVPQLKGAPESCMRPGQLDVDPRNAVTDRARDVGVPARGVDYSNDLQAPGPPPELFRPLQHPLFERAVPAI